MFEAPSPCLTPSLLTCTGKRGMRVGKGKGYNRASATNAMPSQNRACISNTFNGYFILQIVFCIVHLYN